MHRAGAAAGMAGGGGRNVDGPGWRAVARLTDDGALAAESGTPHLGNSDLLPGASRPQATAGLVTSKIGPGREVCGASKLGDTLFA